jgi:hypothetical protein
MRGKGRLKSMGGDLGRTDCSNRFNANSQLVSCAREDRGPSKVQHKRFLSTASPSASPKDHKKRFFRHHVYFATWVRTWVEVFRQEKTLSKSIT